MTTMLTAQTQLQGLVRSYLTCGLACRRRRRHEWPCVPVAVATPMLVAGTSIRVSVKI
jgi:hypothetical protein